MLPARSAGAIMDVRNLLRELGLQQYEAVFREISVSLANQINRVRRDPGLILRLDGRPRSRCPDRNAGSSKVCEPDRPLRLVHRAVNRSRERVKAPLTAGNKRRHRSVNAYGGAGATSASGEFAVVDGYSAPGETHHSAGC
jgi:hypothetical protein